MKKIMTGIMFLAIALFMCSGIIATPAMAVEGVIQCRTDADCDNGLDSYCTSIPFCDVGGGCDDSECDGVCMFIDPCAKYPHAPVCDQQSEFEDERACVECVVDRDCSGSRNGCDSDKPGDDMFDGACIDNECFECRDDGDCFEGAECVNGECIDCVVDEDCEEGELCRNGSCCGEAVPGPEPECFSDSDCLQENTGAFCDIQGTCLSDGTCDNTTDQCTKIGQFCVEADQKCAWCIEDADCEGWYCDEFPETTGPICNGNADCRDCGIDDDCADNETFCLGTFSCTETGCEQDNETYDPCTADKVGPDTPVCDDVNDRCVEECVVDQDCDDLYGPVENFCNGTRVCNPDGICEYSGTTCPSGQCLPIAEKCYDCEDNADCANFFVDKPVCVTVYDENEDPDTNYCAECLLDTDCADGVCLAFENDPKSNVCVDCIDDDDCEGTDTCLDNVCVECNVDCPCPDDTYCLTEYPSIGCPIVGELNVCVECTDDSECPAGELCKEAECGPCEDIYDECGEFQGTVCEPGTLINECVECLDDSDCGDRLRDLDDPFAVCNVDGKCDDNTNTCSYTNPCGQLECFPAGYYNSEDFGKVTADCDDSDCPTFDYYCADCANDEACMDDLYCNGVESCTKDGCVAGTSPCAEGLLCDEATDACLAVDCITDTDCMFFETCDEQNECAEIQSTCGLKINPKKMKANKLFARDSWTFKIKGLKGQTGFDPNAPKYFGEQITEIESVVKKGKLKSKVRGDSANPINPGILEIWVGTCKGQVILK